MTKLSLKKSRRRMNTTQREQFTAKELKQHQLSLRLSIKAPIITFNLIRNLAKREEGQIMRVPLNRMIKTHFTTLLLTLIWVIKPKMSWTIMINKLGIMRHSLYLILILSNKIPSNSSKNIQMTKLISASNCPSLKSL